MNISDSIYISCGDKSEWAFKGAILVPEKSLEIQTLVKPVIPQTFATPKDIAFSLIQIALSGFEDREIPVENIDTDIPIVTVKNEETASCTNGLVVFWSTEGIKIWAHENSSVDKLLKIAHRECTRWIRLDVK